ncbi:MAG: hypothetical protein ACOCP4_03115 [Candidatus Woesearchaeota archaeon]
MQPDGKEPIYEPEYDGYGNFGGVDAHEWLALNNLPKDVLMKLDKDENLKSLRSAGIDLSFGKIFKDKETGKLWTVFRKSFLSLMNKDIEHFTGTYSEIIPEIGKTPNELIENGRFIKFPVNEFIRIKKPLKFSFNENAKYEELPASKDCPNQGYFLDYDYDEEVPGM